MLPRADTPDDVAEVKKQVAEREGATNPASQIKDDLAMYGFRVVYSDFQPKFKPPKADALADAAIKSVQECLSRGRPFMNGIRYLFENVEWGVETELTQAYINAILAKTCSSTLEEAEFKKLKEVAAASAPHELHDRQRTTSTWQ